MRKYICLFLLLLVLGVTGCKKDKQPEPTPNPTPSPDINVDPEPEKDPVITISSDEVVQQEDIFVNIENDDIANYNVTFNDQYAFNYKDGAIRCKRYGDYTITITHKTKPEITKSFNVKVYSKNFTIYTSSEVIQSGDKFKLEYEGNENSREQSLSDFVITFNDPSLVEINGDVITTKARGDLEITAVSKYSENVKTTISVKITDIEQNFLIRPEVELAQLNIGGQTQMFMSKFPGLEVSDLNWSSSADEVARVTKYWDGQIVVSAVGEGVCDIQCYDPNHPQTRASYRIYVSDVKEDVDYIYRLVMTAFDEVGTYEGRDPDGSWNNDQKYGKWYGNNGQPWCATFVSWSWYHAGLSTRIFPKYQGCIAGREWAINHGIWHNAEGYQPKNGDLIFYWNAAHTVTGHTGIVAYADSTHVYTIEGNFGQHVGVWRCALNDKTIMGYASPKYPSCSKRENQSWIKNKKVDGNNLWNNHDGRSTQ